MYSTGHIRSSRLPFTMGNLKPTACRSVYRVGVPCADVWRGTPLCMAQYRRLFGAHRKAVVNDPDEMRVCEVRMAAFSSSKAKLW